MSKKTAHKSGALFGSWFSRPLTGCHTTRVGFVASFAWQLRIPQPFRLLMKRDEEENGLCCASVGLCSRSAGESNPYEEVPTAKLGLTPCSQARMLLYRCHYSGIFDEYSLLSTAKTSTDTKNVRLIVQRKRPQAATRQRV